MRKTQPLGELVVVEVYGHTLEGKARAAGAARYYRELGYRVRVTRRQLRVEGDTVAVSVVSVRKRRIAGGKND